MTNFLHTNSTPLDADFPARSAAWLSSAPRRRAIAQLTSGNAGMTHVDMTGDAPHALAERCLR